jgi:hypothetical protein
MMKKIVYQHVMRQLVLFILFVLVLEQKAWAQNGLRASGHKLYSDTLEVNSNSRFDIAFNLLIEKIHSMVIEGKLSAYASADLIPLYTRSVPVGFESESHFTVMSPVRGKVSDTLVFFEYQPLLVNFICAGYTTIAKEIPPKSISFLQKADDTSGSKKYIYSLEFETLKTALNKDENTLLINFIKNTKEHKSSDTLSVKGMEPPDALAWGNIISDIEYKSSEGEVMVFSDELLNFFLGQYGIANVDCELFIIASDFSDPFSYMDSVVCPDSLEFETRRVVVHFENYDSLGNLHPKPVPVSICMLKKGKRTRAENAYCLNYNVLNAILTEKQMLLFDARYK